MGHHPLGFPLLFLPPTASGPFPPLSGACAKQSYRLIFLDALRLFRQSPTIASASLQTSTTLCTYKLHLADDETVQDITGMSSSSSTDIVGYILFYN